MSEEPALVSLGNFTIDDLVLPDGTERPGCTGGDALYATLAARPWQPSAEMVAPVGADFPAQTRIGIAAAGLSDSGLPVRPLPTLRNRVEYFADGDRKWTLYATEGEFDLLSPTPDDIPARFRHARAYLVLAMTLAAQERLVADLKATTPSLVALDPQEDYIKGNEERVRTLISRADIFLPSAEEVQLLFGTRDWSAAARTLAQIGPRTVVVKLGDAGCLVYDAANDVEFSVPACAADRVVDTTGAGDSFCGAFVAALVENPNDLKRAARAGCVAASFAVAGFGVDGLIGVSADQMRSRLAQWRA